MSDNLLARKRCSRCRVQCPRSSFAPDRRHVGDGLQSHCKPCKALDERDRRRRNPDRVRAAERDRRRRNPAARKAAELRGKYGLEYVRYQQMLTEQDGACAICHRPFALFKKGPAVDHDHATGRVRGLLCGPCNIGLAAVERPGYVTAALAYLGVT